MTKNYGIDFNEFCYNHSIIVNHSNVLTKKVRGFRYYDGFYYNVVLNNRYSHSRLEETAIHKIIHVLQNHFSHNVSNAWKEKLMQ